MEKLMNTCKNHPDRNAFSICHNCGEHYCEDCLSEGKEYYYCNKPECQAALRKEIPGEYLKPLQVCPNCKKEFKLSEDIRKSGKVHCPECEAFIDFTTKPPSFKPAEEFAHLLDTMNQGDIALAISILDDGDFDYYISGQNFARIDPLIQPARFFVRKDQLNDAIARLKDVKFNIFGVSSRNQD
jgi:DNA-directed RNA polymerase subunit RPC12/RpoP